MTKSIDRHLAIALPKGSLQGATFELMSRAGFAVREAGRSYYLTVDDPELSLRLIRPQDIPRYVHRGLIDAGITGKDWVEENGVKVRVVMELTYAKQSLVPYRWVLAVPEASGIKSVKDLQGKRIATELVRVTQSYLSRNGVRAEVEFSHGATEAKAPDLVDAIVEGTETGASLRANGLRIVATVMESVTQLVANEESWKNAWKRRKLQAVAMLLEGALVARDKVGLKMNVRKQNLAKVLAKLPALKRPTVSPLADTSWCAVETVMDEKTVRDIIQGLKDAGAQGIIEYPLNKVII